MRRYKKLTAKEEQFVLSRVCGKTQIDAFKDAGYALSTTPIMAVEASRIESRPHIKERIQALKSELQDIRKVELILARNREAKRLYAMLEATRTSQINSGSTYEKVRAINENALLATSYIKALNKLWHFIK